jgi:hypothetical protein
MCGIRLASSPVVDAASLQELKILLSATSADGVVQGQHLSVDDAGENDAKIIKAAVAGAAEALSSRGKNSGVERTAIGSSATSACVSRSTVARSGRSRASRPRRREMARRGELIVSAPVGFVKTEEHSLEQTPDLRVQQAIELAFEKVGEFGSVRQTLLWFLEHGLKFPVHNARGELNWRVRLRQKRAHNRLRRRCCAPEAAL